MVYVIKGEVSFIAAIAPQGGYYEKNEKGWMLGFIGAYGDERSCGQRL